MPKDNKISTLLQSLHQHIKLEKKVTIYGPLKIDGQIQRETAAKIFVDGGLRHAKNVKNIISIGDGDSTDKIPLIKHPKAKDQSDLALALDLIKTKNIIVYLRGFIPFLQIEKRWDHLFTNFGEAYYHAKKRENIIDFDQNIRIYPKGIHQFKFKGNFSIIFFEKTKIKLIGKIQFPIAQEKKILPLQSHLISNSAKGEFHISTSHPFLLIRN